MSKHMLIHLLENFAATPSDVDSNAIELYIQKNKDTLLALNPARTPEMINILNEILHLLDSDFDSLKFYRVIDKLRYF